MDGRVWAASKQEFDDSFRNRSPPDPLMRGQDPTKAGKLAPEAVFLTGTQRLLSPLIFQNLVLEFQIEATEIL